MCFMVNFGYDIEDLKLCFGGNVDEFVLNLFHSVS